jgi:hypothetical protein
VASPDVPARRSGSACQRRRRLGFSVCRLAGDPFFGHDAALPQGAPTSGAVLNLVCARLDRLVVRLSRASEEHYPHLRYSRYADDLTFTSAIGFPPDFVTNVIDVVRRCGFRINRRKLRRTSVRHGDLVVCGVRIHDGELTLERRVLRRYRALLHRIARRASTDVTREERDLVHGVLGHLTMVSPRCPAMLSGPLDDLIRRHGEWLHPARGEDKSVPFPRYGW